MSSYEWIHEMENMLSAFYRQAIHSLSIMKRSGLSFTPDFKEHFMQVSNHRISEAYAQFQINVMVEKQLSPISDSVAIVSQRSEASGVERETDDRESDTSLVGGENDWITNASDSVIQIDDPNDDEVVMEAHETEPTDDKALIEKGASSNASPTKEMHELNDSFEMVQNQIDLIDADDSQLIPVNIVSNYLDETIIPQRAGDKSETMSLNRKNPHKKRMMTTAEMNENRNRATINGKKSALKLSTPGNQTRCTVCGRVSSFKNLSRHMRTHTGEKLYGCDRCGRRFKSAASLTKHASTHIADFPHHCRACFRGFSWEADAVAHEKQCQKRRYECHICKQYVNCNKSKLIIHMRTHTGDKPFRCEICMRRFGHKQNLKQHLNTVHSAIRT